MCNWQLAGLIILIACVFEANELFAATADTGENSTAYSECCQKMRVEDERGQWYEERWMCTMSPYNIECECRVTCLDCGLDYLCAKVNAVINTCQKSDSQGDPFQHCTVLDDKYTYTVTFAGDFSDQAPCTTLVSPCYSANCTGILMEQECAIRCGNN